MGVMVMCPKTFGNILIYPMIKKKKKLKQAQVTVFQTSFSNWLYATALASFCLLSVHPAKKSALHHRTLERDFALLSVPALKHSEWCLDKMSAERDEKINEDDIQTLNSKQSYTWRVL